MTEETRPPLMIFPCDFTIKVIGLKNDAFEVAVLGIIHKHIPNLSNRAFKTRVSGQGKYLAMTITFHVDSKERLDNLYVELSGSPLVIMAL